MWFYSNLVLFKILEQGVYLMKKFWKLFMPLGVIFLFIAACSEKAAPTDSNQPKIVTSIFPMYEIVKEIAGNRAEVSLMVGANEDAHHYEPSAQAVASVNEADVFVYSSKDMEFWVNRLLDVVENENLHIVEFSNGLDLKVGEPEHSENLDDHDHGDSDPHFWLNLQKVNKQLYLIVKALSEVDPEGSEYYQKNAEKFSSDLLALDQAYLEAFKDAEHRMFVVQHQAFGHLADRYNLEQVSVGGLSTELEASPKVLAEIIDFVKEQNVPVIYYQSGDYSAVAETIAKETNTEIAVLYDLESEPADINIVGNTYLEAMVQNLEQLKKSIQ